MLRDFGASAVLRFGVIPSEPVLYLGVGGVRDGGALDQKPRQLIRG